MQLSARILTALAVLTVTVAMVAGQASTPDASAAAGSIAVLNIGTCVTSDADVLDEENCNEHYKTYGFNRRGVSSAIERSEVYATYAHDPKTAAEEPRAILEDSDLILVSITDTGRDTRTPVLVGDGVTPGLDAFFLPDNPNTPVNEATLTIRGIISDDLGIDPDDVPDVEDYVEVQERDSGAPPHTISGGPTDLILSRTDNFAEFKPIADTRGKVVFYGSAGTNAPDYNDIVGFDNLEDYVRLDEDVISGDLFAPPALRILGDVPSNVMVKIELIYYETSGLDYIEGGEICGDGIFAPDFHQATCTSDELEDPDDPDAFLMNASSDGNNASQNMYLLETGYFTGEFHGYLALTDADGDGRGDSTTGDNWGGRVRDPSGNGALWAVLGVGDGPVTINYRDTDGSTRTLDISIDIEPPVIEISSPSDKSRSDDDNPEFSGTINDGSSGLASDSFALYVDNTDDRSDDRRVLDLPERGVTSSEGAAGMQIRLQYTGYDQRQYSNTFLELVSVFGVIKANDLYKDLSLDVVPTASPDGADDVKGIEADSFDDGDSDATFDNDVKIDFPLPNDEVEYNHQIDFQAFVRDLAGNIGFSDSDATQPLFINDLGTKLEDRDLDAEDDVIGMFRRHIVYLDGVDPVWDEDRSVTGFYGVDGDDAPIVDRSGVMIVFDGPVDPSSIDTETFTVGLDDDSFESVTDVAVEDELVFLKLASELPSDATPTISIADGHSVLDLAQNVTRSDELDDFDANDGITPVFSVDLSGGSGVGSGSEGPSRLTNDTMNIKITSDEEIAGAPNVSVVCSNIKWTVDDKDTPDDASDDDVGDAALYQSNRTGTSIASDRDDMMTVDDFSCGGSGFDLREARALTRPGETWEYVWRNSSEGNDARVPDGVATVVIWGRDRSTYTAHDSSDTHQNWGSANASFTFDDTFISPLESAGGEVQPGDAEVDEVRPFVLLDFAGEPTTVRVTELSVDGSDVLDLLEDIGDNRFLYWPETLSYGDHRVVFSARDAADNDDVKNEEFVFKVTARDDYKIRFVAGWNAISFPADPVDTALESVFSADDVDRVIGWDATSVTGPWSIATKVDGVWMTSEDFAPLTDVHARYGYWVHSTGFIDVSVSLRGPLSRETSEYPGVVDIPTDDGWNFVGVVDQDGDQTEDHFGAALQDSDGSDVPAKDYLSGFSKAYTWDEIGNRYAILGADDPMVIGDGVWVYFPEGTNIGP